jgi:hypothetical protein
LRARPIVPSDHGVRRWFFVALWVLPMGCPKPMEVPTPVPHGVVGAPKRYLGPLVPIGLGADHVSAGDAPVKGDGDPDYEFRVRISGEVRALILHGSDGNGEPVGGEIWDTLTAPERFPPSWRLPVAEARHSWALAVFDQKETLLNPRVTLERNVFVDETITLFAGDLGHGRFVSGRTYTLLVIRPDGSRDRATTTIL